MEIKKNSNHDIFKILLIVFSFSFVVILIFFLHKNDVLETDTEGLEHIKFIRDGVERVTMLTFENSSDGELYSMMETLEEKILPLDGNYKYFADNREIIIMISKLKYSGLVFKKAVFDYNEFRDEENLIKASEVCYFSYVEVIEEVNQYISELSLVVEFIKTVLLFHVIVMVSILFKLMLDKLSELQKNKFLTRDMKIDIETGIFNRVKCQELLSAPLDYKEEKETVILVFELNNDIEFNTSNANGSKGDLLKTFAEQLKKTTTIFEFEIFLGRYEENKFMVYFLSDDEKNVEVFLDDINYLIDRVNIIEKKSFRIAFFVGYIITTERMREFTMQQLFDVADQNMSFNKIAIQEVCKHELA